MYSLNIIKSLNNTLFFAYVLKYIFGISINNYKPKYKCIRKYICFNLIHIYRFTLFYMYIHKHVQYKIK